MNMDDPWRAPRMIAPRTIVPPRRGRARYLWAAMVSCALATLLLAGCASAIPIPSAPTAPPGPVTVTYNLTGSAQSANVTYTDGSGNIQQQTGLRVPLQVNGQKSGMVFRVASGSFVQFSAQNQGASGDLTCTIQADGVTVNTGHAVGGFAIVSCSARLP